MIARGSTRLTVPVMSSPSRLANWSKTTSRSASRSRCRTTCLAVWAPIRPKTSCRAARSRPGRRDRASGLMRVRRVDGHLGELVLDLARRPGARGRHQHLAASRRRSGRGRPRRRGSAGRPTRCASSIVRIRCSRGTPFSALSWRRAPTKSRLMRAPPFCVQGRVYRGPLKKETWGSPTSRSGRSVGGSITRMGWTLNHGARPTGSLRRWPAGNVSHRRCAASASARRQQLLPVGHQPAASPWRQRIVDGRTTPERWAMRFGGARPIRCPWATVTGRSGLPCQPSTGAAAARQADTVNSSRRPAATGTAGRRSPPGGR